MKSTRYVGTTKEAKPLLEAGERVKVSSGCIGHSRHCAEQEDYKKILENEYGDKLKVELSQGACRYSYIFSLVK